jgi:hypothetical protein
MSTADQQIALNEVKLQAFVGQAVSEWVPRWAPRSW